MDKHEWQYLMEELEAAYRADYQDDRVLVPGEGERTQPRLMLFGEAPGKEEVPQRRPFVGKAGKNLDAFLQVLGLERSAIYISNVVKVRPVRVIPRGTVANTPPRHWELDFFTPWLLREIALIRPRHLVTLGNTPLQALMGREIKIGQCHGLELPYSQEGFTCLLTPLYHPASIIYNRSLAAVYAQDLEILRGQLGDI